MDQITDEEKRIQSKNIFSRFSADTKLNNQNQLNVSDDTSMYFVTNNEFILHWIIPLMFEIRRKLDIFPFESGLWHIECTSSG